MATAPGTPKQSKLLKKCLFIIAIIAHNKNVDKFFTNWADAVVVGMDWGTGPRLFNRDGGPILSQSLIIRRITMPLRQTPLYPMHLKYGGKIIDFGGWELPVSMKVWG